MIHGPSAASWLYRCCAVLAFGLLSARAAVAGFSQPDAQAYPQLFVWTDTCNVWVWREGDTALLIDLGDGSVLDHLGEIGVKRVEWVLFTHHHREQCQGAPRLSPETQTAASLTERPFFETPTEFRKMHAKLADPFSVYGASFVRPPIRPIRLSRTFEKQDTFTWRGHEFWCLETRGSSPGAMSYLLRVGERWLAFSGDAMLEGGRLHNWPDSEWDYGFGAGIWALANSAGQLEGYDPAWLLPAHGPAIRAPAAQLAEFQTKLRRFEKVYLRGYPVLTFSGTHQDRISRPTKVPHLWQVSPHIFKLRGPDYYPNFYLIVSDNGHGLAIDCGSLNIEQLDRAILGLREHYGLKRIDAVIPTHMHGDHLWGTPHLRDKWGAEIWALDRMRDVCEHPEWFDYAAAIWAYGKDVDSVPFQRTFKDGEPLRWENFDLVMDWMPGQTEFALAVQGTIDGKRVVFTGDNLFGDPSDPTQNGHEAVVAHNSSVLEEGYILGAEYLSRLKPDLILGGHSYVMPEPAAFVERYRKWSYTMRDAFQELIREDDYRYGYDPYWVRAQPYRTQLTPGNSAMLTLHVRNFSAQPQTTRIVIDAPPGLKVEPATLDVETAASGRSQVQVRVSATSDATPGVQLLGLDVTRNGIRYGQRFDAIVEVRKVLGTTK